MSRHAENTPAAVLDDPKRYESLDPAMMHAAVVSFPAQLRQAPDLAGQVSWTAYKPTTPAGICLCGMGGSAIGGDLVRAYWEYESPVPFVIVRNDRLPAMINRFWLVIASSYSGNTVETLTATGEAQQRGCRVLAITTGGLLKETAKRHEWPLITLPSEGLAPRAALGYSFGPVMLALAHWGIVSDQSDQLRAAADFLEGRQAIFQRAIPLDDNPAKSHAAALAGRAVCVYGATGTTDVIAYRIKCQLCENAKMPAFAASLPELNHNEIVGMDAATAMGLPAAVITLATADDDAIATRRREWIEQRLASKGIPVVTLTAAGENRLERMLSLVQIGDFISYYLAILNGVDPTPIPAINDLKAHMSLPS
ncbi:MAG TPA: bifunctional phosphoglucose/phosphomannose isomerase [Acidobacteriota bacterium]|nr:bifunctional phosphoglucose/phosphomannose isomerase [Acidobacteriota bacterium]